MKVVFAVLACLPLAYAGIVHPGVVEDGASKQYSVKNHVDGSYEFGYEEEHTSGGTFRKESGDAHGNKVGSYGLKDADGRVRVVNYVADELGYRASIDTNEPGTSHESPADVEIRKAPEAPIAHHPVAVAAPVIPHPVPVPVLHPPQVVVARPPVIARAPVLRKVVKVVDLKPKVAALIGSPALFSHGVPQAYNTMIHAPISAFSGYSYSPAAYSPNVHHAIPATSYVARAAPAHYAAPAFNYAAPAVSYAAPAVSYAAPAVSYAAPAVRYAAPAVSYAAPSVSYAAPAAYGYGGGYGLGSYGLGGYGLGYSGYSGYGLGGVRSYNAPSYGLGAYGLGSYGLGSAYGYGHGFGGNHGGAIVLAK